MWFQTPVSNPISTTEKTQKSRGRGEEANQKEQEERQEDTKQVSDIRSTLFQRSERQKFEQNLRIETYKDYLLKRTEENFVIDSHLQPVGEGKYSDYFCSEHCGCDRIPKEIIVW